jgi:hypothetical protein
MSDLPNGGGNPDLSPDTRQLFLHRARILNRELVVRLHAAEADFDAGEYHAVLGALVLADVQLQHLRAIVRVLES